MTESFQTVFFPHVFTVYMKLFDEVFIMIFQYNPLHLTTHTLFTPTRPFYDVLI
jgi:hypothetical protein